MVSLREGSLRVLAAECEGVKRAVECLVNFGQRYRDSAREPLLAKRLLETDLRSEASLGGFAATVKFLSRTQSVAAKELLTAMRVCSELTSVAP